MTRHCKRSLRTGKALEKVGERADYRILEKTLNSWEGDKKMTWQLYEGAERFLVCTFIKKL